MPTMPEGFVDTSWHNDACQSFTSEPHKLKLGVDYPDPAKRETKGARFTLCTINDDGEVGDVVASAEQWVDMAREIALRTTSVSVDECRAYAKALLNSIRES